MGNSKKEANGISVNEMDYLQITSDIKESPRIQKTEYIRQQMLKRRAMEDELMEHLKQEQSVIDSFRDQINDGLLQTEELSRYNQEFSENMTEQIYLLHGISKDKLEGMQECKNAFRRGYSIILFLLSTALVILCGALYGFQSEICLLMLAITGIEGAMLAQDRSLDQYPVLRLINRVLFPLLCPLMLAMFVCYEMGFAPYDVLLPYIAMAGIVILFLSAVPYFIYDPYKGLGKHMRNARAEIKVVEKVAKKEVIKNQRIRVKEEKKELAEQAKEARKQERDAKKEALEDARNAKKEAKKQARNTRKLSKKQEDNPNEATAEATANTAETDSEKTVTESTTNITEADSEKAVSESTTYTTEADSEKTAAEATTNTAEADPEKTETESTTNTIEVDSEKTAAEATTNTAEADSEKAEGETTKPEPPKKRRSRKKNPVIDISEGAQNLAAQS
ncbi:MAG: hypothetical protein K2J95_06985 [Lachnospiraceae bacterium]|nr:hypothetical protein [Lachnospiraceae bacterium]